MSVARAVKGACAGVELENPDFVAGLRCHGLTAPFVVDRPMNRRIFDTYVETQLAPTLVEGDVVIMDNLAAHKSPAAEKASRERGAWILFLPPTVPTSTRSKWHSPNSRRTCAPEPSEPSTHSGRPSETFATCSRQPNVQTTSKPPDMDSLENPTPSPFFPFVR